MSYSDSQPPFMQASERYSDAISIGVTPEYPIINEQPQFLSPLHYDYQSSQHKRARIDDNQLDTNPLANRGSGNIFFKTRMCAKFRQGLCRNGEQCNFAHGEGDLRQPPANWKEMVGGPGLVLGREESEQRTGNWDDDQRIIHRMKLCKKFYNGEECPYGDRCNFLHEDPSKFRDDSVRSRESSAISIGATDSPIGLGSMGTNSIDVYNKVPAMVNTVGIMKIYRKTKLCSKWETGQCPFADKCNFAHGLAELQAATGRPEGENVNVVSSWSKPQPVPVSEDNPCKTTNVPSVTEHEPAKKYVVKRKGLRKTNMIYGDWLENMPLGPGQVDHQIL
ncbi:hypothetical protein ACFE04_011050 [Oxalis oulophora]